MKDIQKKFFLFRVCKWLYIKEKTNKQPMICSIWGFGELIKKNIQKDDKIPKIGNIKELFLPILIDRKIGINEKIDKYWIRLPNSWDFKAKPNIIKISPPLISKSNICKTSVANIPLFNTSNDPCTWYIKESEWVIGDTESRKKPKKNKINNNKSNLYGSLYKYNIFFLVILDILLNMKNTPKIKITEEINIKKFLLNKPKNKKG